MKPLIKTILILISLISFNQNILLSENLSENVFKIKSVIGDSFKIDSLFNTGFVQSTIVPSFRRSSYKKILSNTNSEFIENYQKKFQIDSTNVLSLELVLLKGNSFNKNGYSLLFFSKDNFSDWKIVSDIGVGKNYPDSNYCKKYLEAYEIIIEKLKEPDFIDDNIEKLIYAFYGIHTVIDKKDPKIRANISKNLLDFYIWEDVYVKNRDKRHICISSRNFINNYYIQFTFKLNWFDNWKLCYYSIFREVSE